MQMSAGQYYVGTITADGGFLAAGSFDKTAEFPADGEHLIVEIAGNHIEWSLHAVDGYESSACGGDARMEQGVLVLDSPTGSGGSGLLPGGPLHPDEAQASLANLMRGLPDWQTKVVLPSELLPPELPPPHRRRSLAISRVYRKGVKSNPKK